MQNITDDQDISNSKPGTAEKVTGNIVDNNSSKSISSTETEKQIETSNKFQEETNYHHQFHAKIRHHHLSG